jgi:hypothetical protein
VDPYLDIVGCVAGMVGRTAGEHKAAHESGGVGRPGGRRHILLETAGAQQQRPVARIPVQLVTRTLKLDTCTGLEKILQASCM